MLSASAHAAHDLAGASIVCMVGAKLSRPCDTSCWKRMTSHSQAFYLDYCVRNITQSPKQCALNMCFGGFVIFCTQHLHIEYLTWDLVLRQADTLSGLYLGFRDTVKG